MEKVNNHNNFDSNQKQKDTELNKLRLVFEQTPGAIFILDKNFKFEYVNPSFTTLSGFSKEELLGRTVAELFYHKDLPESRNDIVKSLLNGEKWQGELLTFNKNGSNYWANTIAAPYKDEAGNVDGYIIIQQDITEKRQMQVSLEESEKFYRTLIESSMDAVSLNQNGKFLLVNSAFCTMFGYTNQEIFSMVPESFIAPEDRERVMNYHYKRMQGGVDKQNYTASFIHKSGKKVLTELNATTVQVNGQNASFITMSDITERNEMEKALRESEAKYKTLVENSQDGILIVRDNRVLFANNTICNVLGYCTEGLELFSSVDIIHPDDQYKVLAIAERRRNQDFSTINETFRMIAKNGEIKECETTSTLIEFEGQWASFFTVHDVTDSKRMQLELKESEEKYRQLFAAESDAIFMIDAESGQILDANPATSSIYGYSHDELLKMKNTDISAEPEKTSQATKNNETRVNHRLHRRKDGTVFPVELSAGFTQFKNRKIQIVTSRDITERIKGQEALSKSEQKYRELAEMLPQAIYELDAKGIPTYLNKAGKKAFGIENSITGNKAFDFFIPTDTQRMKSALKMEAENLTVNEGDIISQPSEPAEFTAKRYDGSTFPVLIYGTSIVENGKVVGSRGMIVDISDRKAMENTLRESEEKYRSLIENATDGIVIVQNGLLKFANQTMCDIMKYSLEELIEKPFLNYIDKNDHELLKEFHARRMVGEQFSNILRSQFIRKDGKMITVELNARTSNYNGSPAGFIIIRDITERLKIENELQTAKNKLELLNSQLEQRVKESSESLTEARTQLINLQKENLQSQFDVLKQQVNPHFLFNSLNVLTSLIKLEPDLAEKFSEQLSKVYRYVLENKDNELVDLNTELNFLDAYIFLLNIRFVDKLRVNINIPADRRANQIIPLAMQLLIENAIKHNIMSKSEPLSIDVFIDSDNFLNIVNNLQERPSQLVSTGVGLKNIQNRYLLLNNTEPIFEKTESHFIAKVPLVLN